ncbi:molybdenum cofactor guanylyltransferase MobA [Niveispirillum irakense]|uniref:molybdenum cofactor guanylyltransferase MobA n=1 Tax=Niveispirillum irakense TaxID=34011 RepID=UPI001FE1E6E7|nr:molybdenum cofactor guanylyltransferase MobA [Niveispirillum irakense]
MMNDGPGQKAPQRPSIAGVILAGGLATRLGGGDKALRLVAGLPLLTHIIDRLAPQVGPLILNANGDPARFAGVLPDGCAIIPDGVEGHPGPLAGVLAAMEWACATDPTITDIVTVPGDCPFLPADLVCRLWQARAAAGTAIACARTVQEQGARPHPVVALWPVRLAADLHRALVEEDIRRVGHWAARHGTAHADYSDKPFDPFFNINRPEDLEIATGIAASLIP